MKNMNDEQFSIGIDEQEAMNELTKNYGEAEKLLKDHDKVEEFLQKLEKKIKLIPHAGNALANIPIMASLVKSYIKKEYAEVPIGTIIAVLSALIYYLSPFDLIIDGVPVLGSLDDIAVIGVCLKLVESDIKDYDLWRHNTGKTLDI